MAKFVNWFRNNKPELVTIDEYNKKLEWVIANFKHHDFKTRALRLVKGNGTYSIYNCNSYIEIRYIDDCIPHQIRFSKNGLKTENIGAGREGLDHFNHQLKELTNDDDITLFKIFSGNKYKEEYKTVKNCVISPFDYCNEYFTNRKIKVYKADVSSAYPFELTKSLPTFHDCKKVEGRVEPTAEYPFAFYINSRHVKIYNELYTRDFKNTKYPYKAIGRIWNPKDNVKAEDDITILCKEEKQYSKYIKQIALDLYTGRKEHPEYKIWLNAFIGKLQSNSNPFASCVSAVVIARCANNMIQRCKQLESECNIPVLVNTDSISWINKNDSTVYTTEKAIGNFVLEYENTDMLIKSVKAYQYMTENGCKTVFSGIKKELSKNFKFGDILNYNDAVYLINITDEGFIEV